MTNPILPGAVRQNGYVVDHLDAAIESWLALGVGPWITMRDITQPNTQYRDGVISPTLSIAFANSGPLQIELIQQLDDGPSLYREFLDAGRGGFHHLAWWADDFDATMTAIEAAGWPIVQAGDGGGAARYLYTELDTVAATAIEVMQHNDITRWMTTTVAAAAAGWDGHTDPVRPLF